MLLGKSLSNTCYLTGSKVSGIFIPDDADIFLRAEIAKQKHTLRKISQRRQFAAKVHGRWIESRGCCTCYIDETSDT